MVECIRQCSEEIASKNWEVKAETQKAKRTIESNIVVDHLNASILQRFRTLFNLQFKTHMLSHVLKHS